MENQNETMDPVIFEVAASKPWQKTGCFAEANVSLHIEFSKGFWHFNPQLPLCGPDGNPRFIAKPGYSLPGAPEGALVGRIGGQVFLVGKSAYTPPGLTGELELCINDDLEGLYGAGLKINSGSIKVEITKK